MTALRDDLRRLLEAFDDEALAALASKGLVRRAQKELERVTATIATEDAESLTLAIGDQQVRLDRRGPTQARCSCPASTTCQHVLVAVLALQRLLAAHAPTAARDGASAPAATSTLHDSLMAIQEPALREHAGAAGWRWAMQFALDFDIVRHLRIEARSTLVITLLHPHLVAHYAGGDFAALVLDTKLAQAEKHRAAVVLIYQRAHGKEPATESGRTQARLDLGEDFTPATAVAAERIATRDRLREAVRALARECLECGLSHLSPQMQQRFATLAVSAQGSEYHRLARMLRRLADHVELLQQRAGGADEHRLLDELTIAAGLVDALDHAAARREEPLALVGRARSAFADTASLEVLGLGARPFRSPSGHAGLTMLFWSTAEGTFLSCTDARPLALRSFDPVARYDQPGPWSGLGAPRLATGRRITLAAARRNEQGRLSAAERTHAIVQPAGDAFAAVPVVQRWSELPARLDAASPPGLLAEPQPMLQWALLAPATWQPATFDRVRQELNWPLVDSEGNVILARLPWSAATQPAIARIERLPPAAAVARPRVVAQLRRSGNTLRCEPLSLLSANATMPVDCLYFDRAADMPCPVEPAAGQISPVAAGDVAPIETATALPPALDALRTQMRQLAERGSPAGAASTLLPTLKPLLERAHREGLTAFRLAPSPAAGDAAAFLLQTNFVLLQYERVLASPEAEDHL